MIRSYLTTATRNLRKNRRYALANIAGLSVGIAFFAMLLLIVRSELSHDQIHLKAERIYRAIEFLQRDGIGERSASMPFPVGPAMQKDFPEYVESAVRIFDFQTSVHSVFYNEKKFLEKRFYFADSTFFKIFDYPLQAGSAPEDLGKPNRVFISAEAAERFFGTESPLGKTIMYEGKIPLVISGVFEPRSYQSHFVFDFIASFVTLEADLIPPRILEENWVWNPCWTYILLKEGTSPEDLEYRLGEFIDKHFAAPVKRSVSIYLQPLTEIHLHSDLDYEMEPNGDIQYIYLFGVIAVLLIIVASINFINLSTARASTRAKEIGVRKAMGAHRWELMTQFLVEYLLISTVASLLSMALVEVVHPYLPLVMGIEFDFSLVGPWYVRAVVLSVGLIVGTLSSIYPAYYLASFEPAQALGGTLAKGSRGKGLRSVLVVIQFSITIFLMICTLVAFRQYEFLQEYSIGFDQSRLMFLPAANTRAVLHFDSLKVELERVPGVERVSAVDEILGKEHQTHQFKMDSAADWIFLPSSIVRHDLVRTYGLTLVAGRDFRADSVDEASALIVNERFVAYLGLKDPQEALGKVLLVPTRKEDWKKVIVGVVKDFHFESLHLPITPFVLQLPSNEGQARLATRQLVLRLSGNKLSDTSQEQVKQIWSKYLPNSTFAPFMLQDALKEQYQKERKLALVSGDFALIAILLACLGLFGLASFVVEQRKREIAIRKALGASNGEIVILLSKEFLQLVGLAALIAWPVSFLVIAGSISAVSFEKVVDPFFFLFSGAIALGITLVTISYHTVRAALRHPAEALG